MQICTYDIEDEIHFVTSGAKFYYTKSFEPIAFGFKNKDGSFDNSLFSDFSKEDKQEEGSPYLFAKALVKPFSVHHQ